jgi:hypothetical protein
MCRGLSLVQYKSCTYKLFPLPPKDKACILFSGELRVAVGLTAMLILANFEQRKNLPRALNNLKVLNLGLYKYET